MNNNNKPFAEILKEMADTTNKYGDKVNRDEAADIFGVLCKQMMESAEHGHYTIKFDSDEIPDKYVKYIKFLCELNNLKFVSQSRRSWGQSCTVYIISWENTEYGND